MVGETGQVCSQYLEIWIYLNTYWLKYLFVKYSLNFRGSNKFGKFLEFKLCIKANIFKHSNIFGQIFLFRKYFLGFEVTNIFGYLFVREKLHSQHTKLANRPSEERKTQILCILQDDKNKTKLLKWPFIFLCMFVSRADLVPSANPLPPLPWLVPPPPLPQL